MVRNPLEFRAHLQTAGDTISFHGLPYDTSEFLPLAGSQRHMIHARCQFHRASSRISIKLQSQMVIWCLVRSRSSWRPVD